MVLREHQNTKLSDYCSHQVYFKGNFYPICENGFKNNNIGAKKICQYLDFQDGFIAPYKQPFLEEKYKSPVHIEIGGELSPEQSLGNWSDLEFEFKPSCEAVQVICLTTRKCRVCVDFVSIKVDYVIFFLDMNHLWAVHMHTHKRAFFPHSISHKRNVTNLDMKTESIVTIIIDQP